MGLEAHAFKYGQIEGTAEGIALGFVVLLLSRARSTSLLGEIRATPIDYDGLDFSQLH
jgi:hypothetical protein